MGRKEESSIWTVSWWRVIFMGYVYIVVMEVLEMVNAAVSRRVIMGDI